MKDLLLNKAENLKTKVFAKPKKVFAGAVAVMILSLIFSILQYCFFPPKVSLGESIPVFYSKSEKVKSKLEHNEKEMEKVVSELAAYQQKSREETLTKSDSIRIEYLYQQYQKLKNGL